MKQIDLQDSKNFNAKLEAWLNNRPKAHQKALRSHILGTGPGVQAVGGPSVNAYTFTIVDSAGTEYNAFYDVFYLLDDLVTSEVRFKLKDATQWTFLLPEGDADVRMAELDTNEGMKNEHRRLIAVSNDTIKKAFNLGGGGEPQTGLEGLLFLTKNKTEWTGTDLISKV